MKTKFIMLLILSLSIINVFCGTTTELLSACSSGNIDTIRTFLNSGINPNVSNSLGQSPLHMATMYNKYEVIKLLLNSGANVNTKDVFGKTPIQYSKSDKVLKLLLHAKNRTDIAKDAKGNNYKSKTIKIDNEFDAILEEIFRAILLDADNKTINYNKNKKSKIKSIEPIKNQKKNNKDEKTFTFKDLAGKIPEDIREITEFIKSPEKFHRLGAQMPRGILLVGPPGTGKTSIARAIAGEGQASFFNASATQFIEQYVGLGPKRIRELFDKAREATVNGKKAIVFIDEIDAIGGARGAGNDCLEYRNTLNELLNQMDGFDRTENITVIGATNTPDFIDQALKRPGRFDRIVTIGLPDLESREQILQHYIKAIKHEPNDIDLKKLAAGLDKFSPADIKNLINEAAIRAARENATTVKQAHFDNALESVTEKKKQERMFID